MNDNTSYREKGRAVFLAAIMVLSVVAMSAAFAGSAAANENFNLEIEDSDDEVTVGEEFSVTVNVTQDNNDQNLGTVSLNFSDSDDVDNDSVELDDDDDYELVELTYTPDDDSYVGDDVSFEVSTNDGQTVEPGTVDVNAASTNPEDEAGINYAYEGSVAWQGQTVIAYGEDFGDLGDEVELRQVNSFSDNDSSFESELTPEQASEIDNLPEEIEDIDGDATVVEIDTSGLEEEFFFLSASELGTGSSSFEEADAFEVSVQSFDVEFDDDEVTDADTTEVEIDSNRGSWAMNVSADGDLDADELKGIFEEDADLTNQEIETDDGEDRITIKGVSDGEYDLNFTDIDTGDYDFDFEVVDTDAEASDSISVVEHDVSADFSQGVYTQTAGDVVEITVELEDTDEAWIQFGDEDAGFIDILHIEDEEDDGEVSFLVNTRLVGAIDAPGGLVYYSDDDNVNSVIHDGLDESTNTADFFGASFYDGDLDSEFDGGDGAYDGFSAYLEEAGTLNDEDHHPTQQIVRPLQATNYDLVASGDGKFIADSGETEADNEIAYATLDLTTPSVDSVTTHVAPGDDANEDDELAELLEVVTERSDVAEEDRLIIQADASGIYGSLLYAESQAHVDEGDWSSLSDGFHPHSLNELVNEWEAEGVNFEVSADDAVGNQDPTQLNLGGDDVDRDDIFILTNHVEGQMFIVVDTSSNDAFEGDLEDGMTFDVELEYETDDDDRFRFGDFDEKGISVDDSSALGDGDAAFPYFGTDSTQSVSTEFTIVEPEVSFDNLDADDNVQLETGEDVVVTGETNVAPGTSGDLRIQNAGDTESFLATEDVEIDSDGTFESEGFDFGDRAEDDEASLNFRVGGSSIGSADGIFVESVEDADDDEPVDADDDEPVDTDDDEPVDTDDDEPAPAPEGDDDEPVDDDDGVPGFGLGIAVVALLAAAMLALRRQN